MTPITYSNVKACVFWDVEAYPIPNGLNPLSMKGKIKSALMEARYIGEVSIQAYSDKNTFSWISFPGTKYGRDCAMILDISLWKLEYEPPLYLIILSKDLEDPDDLLESYCFDDYGFLFSDVVRDWALLYRNTGSAGFLVRLFDEENSSGGSSQCLEIEMQNIAISEV